MKPSRYSFTIVLVLLVSSAPLVAQTVHWEPVTDPLVLRQFMDGLKVQRTLPNGEVARGEYRADGTGTLFAWGAELPRTWTIEDNGQLCISERREAFCYEIERNPAAPEMYRAREVATGKAAEFEVTEGQGAEITESVEPGDQGGAASASADEIAAELSNPNSSVATLTFKNQFRTFEGDLPDADEQTSYTLVFQPGLPFVLENGDKILWRPAIPLLFDQPVLGSDSGDWEGESGIGDIVFDLAYAPVSEPGTMFAYGIITSLPTATNDLGSERWTLGPEVLFGKITPNYVLGMFPNHQWSVGGPGDTDISLTSIQVFYTYLPGGGWSVGSGPTMTYDWEAEQWTVPLQINAGKTVVIADRPWKLSVELNYYVEKADDFGPEWLLGVNFAPVVKNGLAGWFGLQ